MKSVISVLLLITLLAGMIVIPTRAVADTTQNGFVPQIKMICAEAQQRGTPMSADGRYTVFESSASDLVEGDTNGYTDVFVYDSLAGNFTRFNLSSTGNQSNYYGDYGYPAISADGRLVAFTSPANNLSPM